MDLTPRDILGAAGSIARRLPHYEERPEQLAMAEAVTAALAGSHHLLVEAGTGVGKSFAYLVPAILATTAEATSIKRIVISTHTISLQEQLIKKDLPFLNSIIPREFASVLVKGRGNYISLRRLEAALRKQASLFTELTEQNYLKFLVGWTNDTADGSLADLTDQPPRTVWEEVSSDSNNCLGRACPTHNNCFYYRARRRAQHAQLLIVNHALFFSDLALRAQGAGVLPNYDAVIFDEAHTLESVAAEHMGLRVTSGQIEYILRKLYNDRAQKGLLVHNRLLEAQRMVDSCLIEADGFFGQIEDWWHEAPRGNGRVHEPGIFQNQLSNRLKHTADKLKVEAARIDQDADRLDLEAASRRLYGLADSLETWCFQRTPESVYWIERQVNRYGNVRMTLATSPIDIGPILNAELFQKTKSVILASATLSAGDERGFDFIRQRVGLMKAETKQLGSPFNYAEQATLVLPSGIPDPAEDKTGHERCCVELIRHFVQRTDGHAFVLCTSYELLKQLSSRLYPWLNTQQYAMYSQGDGTPRHQLLERFLQNSRGVLFGVDTFWQGVDVPGDALTNVIIPKLPFSVPDQPLLQARLESIRQRGGNPFREYQLPEAVIKLKQGFGRLIRSQRDTGIVVILDPRVRTKPYGRGFLQALPPCRIEEPLAEELRSLAGPKEQPR